MLLFTDASFDKKSGTGAGAILILPDRALSDEGSHANLVQTRVHKSESIAQLELATVLWAFETLDPSAVGQPIQLYTDHQTISELPGRRARLEAAHFLSGRTKQPLNHATLYREFFKIYDLWKPTVTWIKGHNPQAKRELHQKLFSLVDRAARTALRNCDLTASRI